ncbi:MAG: [LysW]-aminoadipate semialdehyde/glutamate semialdehyde transaminase [Candidatus Woesearchaeota archaeon]|nr:[LysW]-aminoadipate semialdehyde/glutamate semialdehyde transaminase [Candidatus Woesearchaeota archaeon]
MNENMAPTYMTRGLDIERGKGIYVYDTQGKKYLDLMTNYGVNIIGHANNAVNKAVNTQIQNLTSLHCSFENKTRQKFAQKLIEITPKNLTKVYLSNSGTESVEAAIKFVWAYSKNRKIITAKLGYHGKTLGALSATTSSPKYQKPFKPLFTEFEPISYNNIEQLKLAVNKKTAAVLLEPIQGESGIRPATKEFLKCARDLCDDNDALLVFDEVQTGLRTGNWTASQLYGIKPDIMCMAKSLANGVPIGVTLISQKVSEKLSKGMHSCTFGGNPLACAAGSATINFIEENNLLEHSKQMGDYFIEQLSQIESPTIREARGRGLMIALDLRKRHSAYLKKLQEFGILAIPAASTVVRFLPPLIIEKEHVDTAVDTLKQIL